MQTSREATTPAPRHPNGSSPREPFVSWVRRAACGGHSGLFDDPADENAALDLCRECPVLENCRTWALHNAVDGVAGGMTHRERVAQRKKRKVTEPVVSADDFMPLEILRHDRQQPIVRSPAILEAVAAATAHGHPARELAERLDVPIRTVVRLLARSRAGVRGVATPGREDPAGLDRAS